MLAGIQTEADERDIGVVVGISDPDGARDTRTINELLGAQVDVLIMISGSCPAT
ncbi:hypothetical protein G7085_09180 [Tessaracoccus sp. HDW20]|uniref:hypothetical protein n=1 Tax=Tessaracoccus coleopterorum TaxID=2714950 RepID=UPI0018D4C414|nr:hypothetical protein [Tessaracoccus coleopterorum]NHB84726.1 hypothetical protein [Tessaracoccus coleopterorum]